MLWGPCTAIILEAACRVSMFFSFWFALAGPLEHCLCTFKAPFLRPSSLVTRGSFGNVLYSLCFAPFPGDLHDSSRHQAAALLFEPRDWKKVLFYSSSLGDAIRRISQCSATRKQSFMPVRRHVSVVKISQIILQRIAASTLRGFSIFHVLPMCQVSDYSEKICFENSFS